MTAQLSRERLEEIASYEIGAENYPRRAEWMQMARMLLAGMDNEPVVYPEKLPCPVLLEPGMRFGKGVKTRLMLEAMHRRAEYYAELDAMTPEQRAEHDAALAEFKAILPAPVAVPDDAALRILFEKWFAADCAFDESPSATEEDNLAWKEGYWHVWKACCAAMLKAGHVTAATVPDGWKLVPINATRAMIDAARRVEEEGYDAMHKAMLAAAPDA